LNEEQTMHARRWIPVVLLCVGCTCLIACWQSVHVADGGDPLLPVSQDDNANDLDPLLPASQRGNAAAVDPRRLEIDNPGQLPIPLPASSADPLEVQRRAPTVPVGSLATGSLSDAGDGWLSLVEADWHLGAGRETHICARITVNQSVYLHEFSPVVPLGTHHTVLSVWPGGSAPDGVVECGPEVSGRQIFGSGIATKPYTLPDGVANATPRTISWGQSSNDEMCFVGLTSFPAMGGSYLCTS
jgi:hypothetical protein